MNKIQQNLASVTMSTSRHNQRNDYLMNVITE